MAAGADWTNLGGDMTRRWTMAVTMAALAVTALAGCSSSLDMAELETSLSEQLAVREQVPATEVTVDCPASVALEQGTTFDCTAAVGDRPLVLTVTELDGDGTVEWSEKPAVNPPG
jgi:hypothetical protein